MARNHLVPTFWLKHPVNEDQQTNADDSRCDGENLQFPCGNSRKTEYQVPGEFNQSENESTQRHNPSNGSKQLKLTDLAESTA